MAQMKKNKTVKDPKQKILKAITSMKKKYTFRTASGLSKQTKIPVEHLEHYLVQLAQRGDLVVLVGDDGQIIARMVEEDDV